MNAIAKCRYKIGEEKSFKFHKTRQTNALGDRFSQLFLCRFVLFWLFKTLHYCTDKVLFCWNAHHFTSSTASTCDFNDGQWCSGWTQDTSDKFDWRLRSGKTPSISTGPSSGHGGSGKRRLAFYFFEEQGWALGTLAHGFDSGRVPYLGWVGCWLSPYTQNFSPGSLVFFPSLPSLQIPVPLG